MKISPASLLTENVDLNVDLNVDQKENEREPKTKGASLAFPLFKCPLVCARARPGSPRPPSASCTFALGRRARGRRRRRPRRRRPGAKKASSISLATVSLSCGGVGRRWKLVLGALEKGSIMLRGADQIGSGEGITFFDDLRDSG